MKLRLASEGPLLLSGTLVSIIIAMSYANNLVYLFAFAWVGFVLVSLVVGVALLKNLQIVRVEAESGFVGDKQRVRIWVKNISDRSAAFLDWENKVSQYEAGPITSLAPDAQTALEASYAPLKRGRHRLPPLCVATTFPSSIFRLSSNVACEEFIYAYPRAVGDRPFPVPSSGLRGEGELGLGRGEDFTGHRAHQKGESERHVDWKLFARTEQKQVKDFVGGSEAHVILREGDIFELPFEARLEQLAKWVLEANKLGISFGVVAAGRELEVGKGEIHRRRALELLATSEEAA